MTLLEVSAEAHGPLKQDARSSPLPSGGRRKVPNCTPLVFPMENGLPQMEISEVTPLPQSTMFKGVGMHILPQGVSASGRGKNGNFHDSIAQPGMT